MIDKPRRSSNISSTINTSSPITPEKNAWCVRFADFKQKDELAQARIFCLHHAGGSASVYREWGAHITKNVSVISIELPGHLSRMGEAPIADVRELVRRLVEEGMMKFMDKPFYIFGHSFGGMLAYEISLYLQEHHNTSPLCLFVSSSRALSKFTTKDSAYANMSSRQVVEYLNNLYHDVNMDKLLASPSLLDVFGPIIKSDMVAIGGYVFQAGSPLLRCPIKYYCGTEESDLIADTELWRDLCRFPDDFEARQFKGGHFYTTNTKAVMDVLNADLDAFLTVDGAEAGAHVPAM